MARTMGFSALLLAACGDVPLVLALGAGGALAGFPAVAGVEPHPSRAQAKIALRPKTIKLDVGCRLVSIQGTSLPSVFWASCSGPKSTRP